MDMGNAGTVLSADSQRIRTDTCSTNSNIPIVTTYD